MSDIVLRDDGGISLIGTLEVTSEGPGAGWAFQDRANVNQRWVWYAHGGRAWLYTDGKGVSNSGNQLSIGAGSELLSEGPGAGYAFRDRGDPNRRWVWYANEGKAHLYADGSGDRLTVLHNGNVGIGIADPQRPLHVEGNEILSSGPGAGFSFMDRKVTKFAEADQPGERWVWYATDRVAKLWASRDVLTINSSGRIEARDLAVSNYLWVNGPIRLSKTTVVPQLPMGGKFRTSSMQITNSGITLETVNIVGTSHGNRPESTGTLDLVEEIRKLREEVNALNAKVGQ